MTILDGNSIESIIPFFTEQGFSEDASLVIVRNLRKGFIDFDTGEFVIIVDGSEIYRGANPF